jgi:coproporphyrinogen III oxidase-like Fe-S oxidoreductase
MEPFVEKFCDYCDWHRVGSGYPELVVAYQDHLRAEHPRAWLRS